MSLRVVGYRSDGSRLVVQEGPAVARVQGHGGEALGSRFMATLVHPNQHSQKTRSEARKTANVQRCGALLPLLQEPCHRLAGHSKPHRSRQWMETNVLSNRTPRP